METLIFCGGVEGSDGPGLEQPVDVGFSLLYFLEERAGCGLRSQFLRLQVFCQTRPVDLLGKLESVGLVSQVFRESLPLLFEQPDFFVVVELCGRQGLFESLLV